MSGFGNGRQEQMEAGMNMGQLVLRRHGLRMLQNQRYGSAQQFELQAAIES